MSKSRLSPILTATLTITLAAAMSARPAFAQAADGPIKMTPEFPLTFPFVVDPTRGQVTVKYPVLINPTTVLKPGVILRTLYVFQQTDDSTDLSIVHASDQAEAYARTNNNDGANGQEKMPYDLAHELEGFRRTVWNTPTNFELAMAQFPTDMMHLIFTTNPKMGDKDLSDQRFTFFDGMFVGQPDGAGVIVLAVEDDSKAHDAGIKAGDEIVAVGGVPLQHDLITFANAFARARQDAREIDAPNYTLSIRSAGESSPHNVNISMPPTIKSSLLHGL